MGPLGVVVHDISTRTVDGQRFRTRAAAHEAFSVRAREICGYDREQTSSVPLAFIGNTECLAVRAMVGRTDTGNVWVRVDGVECVEVAMFASLSDAQRWTAEVAYARFLHAADRSMERFMREARRKFPRLESSDDRARPSEQTWNRSEK